MEGEVEESSVFLNEDLCVNVHRDTGVCGPEPEPRLKHLCSHNRKIYVCMHTLCIHYRYINV